MGGSYHNKIQRNIKERKKISWQTISKKDIPHRSDMCIQATTSMVPQSRREPGRTQLRVS